jgi:HAD superfamily hydrolase (TIGR01509 family)
MIKGVFFDAAGILYRRATPTMDFAMQLLRNGGYLLEITPDEQARIMVVREQANLGQVNHDSYWDMFLRLHGVEDGTLRSSFITRIIDYSNNVSPIPGARETLQALKQRNFLVGIVTDTMYPLEWKKRRLEKVGVAEYIDVIACSTAVGIHKPNPGMYLSAIHQARLSPGESAFVGHLGIELWGAHNAGMLTVAIDPDADAVADYFCKSILELLNISEFNPISAKENYPA